MPQFNPIDQAVEQRGESGMGFDPAYEQQLQDKASAIFNAGTETEETPFDFSEQPVENKDIEVTPNPITTQIMGMALAGPKITDQYDAMDHLKSGRKQADTAAREGQLKSLRMQVALDRSLTKKRQLRTNIPQLTDTDLYRQSGEYQHQVAESNLGTQMKSAVEREALEHLQDVAAGGDTTQARILINRLKPEKADLAAVWSDNMTKSLMLSQLATKYRQEDDEEGWLSSVYTGLISFFQPTAFSYLGNVDDGMGSFVQRNPFVRFFTTGKDLQNQAQAIWNMTPEQLADYLPQLDANIRSNSSYLGGTNPDKLLELVSHFQSPLGDAAASKQSGMTNFDTALFAAPGVGLVPYKLATKTLSVPFTMVRAGARREAAGAVAAAHETLVREGAEAAFAKHGMDEAEVLDEVMPSIINPEKGGPKLNVSLNNEINQVSQMGEDLLKEWSPRSTERFANAEEFINARNAKLEEVQARYGLEAMDYETAVQKLADGTETKVLRVTFGNPRGGLFATEQEAFGWRMSHGFGDGVVSLDQPKIRVIHPREEGYTDVVYHGTRQEIKGGFKESSFGSFGDGIYTTTDRQTAGFYAGKNTGATIHPLLVNGNKIFGFKQLDRSWTVGEIKAAYKELGLKMSPKVKDGLKGLDNEANAAFMNVETMLDIALASNFRSVEKGNSEASHYWNKLRNVLEEKGYHGFAVETGGRGRALAGALENTEIIIFHPDNIKSLFERKTVQDPSGGYANIIEFDIPETGFYTHLNTPTQGATSRFLKNISQTSDEGLYGKGLIADQKANRMYKQIEATMRAAYSPLNKRERLFFEQVVAVQANEKSWLTEPEISTLLERAIGKAPRQELVHAVLQHRVLNDAEFLMRRDGVYRGKVIRGFESVKFHAFDDPIDIDARVDYSPSLAPKSRVYDISNDIHYVGDKKLTNERMQDLASRGYVLVRTEKPFKLKDSIAVDTFVGKRADFEVSRLRRDQLAYSPGGHRIYLSKYQVKQGSYMEQPDTAAKTLKSPNTFVMAGNIRDARRWAATMNEARIAVKNNLGYEHLDEHIFKGAKEFPKGEDFVDQVNKGLIDKNLPFEALYDRDMPSVYKEAGPDLETILGEGEPSGVNGYFRTTGRMYYSQKGDHMLDTYGDLAPTVDPVKAQAMALFNVTRLSASFGDFKESAIERWVNKYRPYLNTRESLNVDEARSNVSIFNKAEPRDGVDFDLKQQMLGQRESIRRILGFETDLDRNYRHWMRSTAEWIIGDSDNKVREKLSSGVFWLYDNNPVSFLRGLAFDAKLGLFNIGQVFIQGSTMASAMALSPRYGAHGLATSLPTMAYFLSKGNENVLERLAKSGVPKLGGFSDVAEWKTYIRQAQTSGFFDLGGSHVMVNDLGPEHFASSIRGGQQHVREMGRWFFYNVEVMNRLVAHRIAYGEALERFGSAQWENNLFQEFIARRAENYSFNMSNGSKSWWQTGLMSIPTQFWAYNVRMIEAMTGKNFTAAQKVRLLASQVAMAGTAGVPIVAGLADMVKTHYGVEPDIDTATGVLHRGIADYMAYEMFGADVNIGERWGTGSWSSDLVRDIFGYSKYNDKAFADVALGSTYSITKGILKPLLGDAVPLALRYMTHESGQEEIDMTGEELMTMFRQISSVNHALQAWEIYNYGLYRSSSGKVIADKIPSEDAVFTAMGFAPAEMNELSTMMGYQKQRKEAIDDASSQIAQWREEALTRPDLYEANAKKVNAFVKFLPAEIRKDVLERAHQKVKPSIYAGVKERFDKTREGERIQRQIEEQQ